MFYLIGRHPRQAPSLTVQDRTYVRLSLGEEAVTPLHIIVQYATWREEQVFYNIERQ